MSNTTPLFTSRIVRVMLVLLIVIAAAYLLFKPQPSATPTDTQQGVDRDTQSAGVSAQAEYSPDKKDPQVLPYKSSLPDLPSSLHGSRIDYQLATDEQGHLRLSSDLRGVFDFFLTAIHEEELERILQRIEEYLDVQLDEPALSEAKSLLASYISLKESLMDYEQEQSAKLQAAIDNGTLREQSLDLLEAQLDARDALRAEHLGAQVQEIFFGAEQQYDRYTLARMRVLGNSQLTEAEKAEQLAQIDAQAPEDLVASRREAQIIEELKQQEAVLREHGADKQAIRQLRTEMFGTEAAERFAALDQSRQAWQQRLDNYLAQRQTLLNHSGLTMDDKTRAIEQLRESLFDEREQIRVKVYERKADMGSNHT
ncbi:MAG: hypothetical protein C9356_19615 [Oleiphilus sp.]|nr:MAG: hypothetical protein C9356_19615 [Oleiphilus sp.]